MKSVLRIAAFCALCGGASSCGPGAESEPPDAGPRDIDPRGDSGGGRDGDAGGDTQVGPPIDAHADVVSTDAGDNRDAVDAGRSDVFVPPEDECATVIGEAVPFPSPVDILWVIDTSGSMLEEMAIIAEQLPAFAEFISAADLDYRVLLMAGEELCIPEPVSGGGCPDIDSERYRHIRGSSAECSGGPMDEDPAFACRVESNDALHWTELRFGLYSDFLRPDAVMNVVVVTDDESYVPAADFHRWASAADALGADYLLHAIASPPGVSEDYCDDFGCWSAGGCAGEHGGAVQAGDEYAALTELTGGVFSSICDSDWQPTFDAIAERVVERALLPCAYSLPEVGDGLVIDYDDVTVRYTSLDGEVSFTMPHLAGPEECGLRGGWYYDDPVAPNYLRLCEVACGEDRGGVEIELGCVKGDSPDGSGEGDGSGDGDGSA